MLAALAASGLAGGSASGDLPKLPLGGDVGVSTPPASSSAGASRRRSLRLSAKKGGQAGEGAQEGSSGQAEGDAEASSTAAQPAESAPSDTVVNDDEFGAEFTDEDVDVDAEVRHFEPYTMSCAP